MRESKERTGKGKQLKNHTSDPNHPKNSKCNKAYYVDEKLAQPRPSEKVHKIGNAGMSPDNICNAGMSPEDNTQATHCPQATRCPLEASGRWPEKVTCKMNIPKWREALKSNQLLKEYQDVIHCQLATMSEPT
jgi:hypothetical protein